MRLVATKPLTLPRTQRYMTRHLVAGDVFEIPDREAAALLAIKAAKRSEEPEAEPAPDPVYIDWPEDDINGLRRKAEALNIKVDGRWSVRRLKAEIEAKG